jgi:hypothetical protein
MYAQKLNGTWRELAGSIHFSETIYQTAESLSDEQRQALSVYFITDAARPQLTSTQKFGNPVFTIQGTNVERSYPVIDKTAQEIQQDTANKASEVRAQRDDWLKATDWSQGKDIADSVSAKYTTYRQALRNVPTQSGFPWTVQWPTKPE